MFQSLWSRLRIFGGMLLSFSVSSPLWAHHAEGGKMPDTFMSALMGGLAHPVIGMDHLVAVLLVGFLAFTVTRRLLEPGVFVLSSLLGCLAHVQWGALPGGEFAVALTLPLFLLTLWFQRASGVRSLLLMIVAGFFHGYAYGEAIIGVGTSQLAAYLLGLSAIQAFLAYGFGALSRVLAEKSPKGFATLTHMLSAVASAAALVFLVTSLR